VAGPVPIEQRPDLHAEEEVQEDVDGGDPADVPRLVGGELVLLPVGLQKTDGLYEP
jgi:hypothetical protein